MTTGRINQITILIANQPSLYHEGGARWKTTV